MTGQTALFVGDVSLDLTMTISHVPAPDEKVHAASAVESSGGVTANAAIACARAGVPARLVVAVGDDIYGRLLVEQLVTSGIDVSFQILRGPTCRVVSLIEPHGEKRLLLHRGVSMFPSREQLDAVPFDGIGWVHSAIYDETAAKLLIDQCRARGVPWSLDLEPSTFPDGIGRLTEFIKGATTVFCNDRAAAKIGGNAIEILLGTGARSVVRTRGDQGASLHEGELAFNVAAPRMNVVDTTGAGDCLAGWFIAERLRGASAEDALKTATLAATLSCARLGGQISYPTRHDIEKLSF